MQKQRSLRCRCRDSRRSEAFLPCSLALLRVQFRDAWGQNNLLVKVRLRILIILLLVKFSDSPIRKEKVPFFLFYSFLVFLVQLHWQHSSCRRCTVTWRVFMATRCMYKKHSDRKSRIPAEKTRNFLQIADWLAGIVICDANASGNVCWNKKR